jgi:hypothetical protein
MRRNQLYLLGSSQELLLQCRLLGFRQNGRKAKNKQGRRYVYDVTVSRVRSTIVAVEII